MLRPKRLRVAHTPHRIINKQGRGPLFFLCLFFLIGALLGSVFALLGGSHPQLALQLNSFFQSTAQHGAPDVSLWRTAWDALCWPLLLVLLSFGPPGVIGIPCVFFVRGFLLSYACSSFVAMYGLTGIGWNAVFFGVTSLILLPILICLGHWAFSCVCRQCFSQESPRFALPSGSTLLCCGILLCLFLFLQGHILPMWLPKLCEKLLSLS